jgi:hypothetical protein
MWYVSVSVWCSLSWKPDSHSAGQEVPCFHRIQRLSTVSTKTCHLTISWARWIHSTPSHSTYLSTIHFNIICYLRLGLLWCFPFQAFGPSFCVCLCVRVYVLAFLTRATCAANLTVDTILRVLGEEYKLWTSLCIFQPSCYLFYHN